MNSNADSEDVLRVGGFYMLLDLTLTLNALSLSAIWSVMVCLLVVIVVPPGMIVTFASPITGIVFHANEKLRIQYGYGALGC